MTCGTKLIALQTPFPTFEPDAAPDLLSIPAAVPQEERAPDFKRNLLAGFTTMARHRALGMVGGIVVILAAVFAADRLILPPHQLTSTSEFATSLLSSTRWLAFYSLLTACVSFGGGLLVGRFVRFLAIPIALFCGVVIGLAYFSGGTLTQLQMGMLLLHPFLWMLGAVVARRWVQRRTTALRQSTELPRR